MSSILKISNLCMTLKSSENQVTDKLQIWNSENIEIALTAFAEKGLSKMRAQWIQMTCEGTSESIAIQKSL